MTVIEFAGIGPGPFAGMMLADQGADVIVIERPPVQPDAPRNPMNRGKRSIVLDLKAPADRRIAWRLLERADALVEGYRPGVMERLGFSPAAVAARNPRLVYGRITGWGQSGPLAAAAGHDLNYVALTGVTHLAAPPGSPPTLPATLIGDMGGGAMFLLYGLMCAMYSAQRTGRGQVVDAAMTDGVIALSALTHALRAQGQWPDDPARNQFLHGAPYFNVYECADGRYITFGALERPFYGEMLARLGLAHVDPERQHDTAQWPALKARIAAIVKSKSQREWCALLEGTDACFAPVLTPAEAVAHPHHVARGAFAHVDGHAQAAPAPRLSASPARTPGAGTWPGEHAAQIRAWLGCSTEDNTAKPQ
ncbi:MAG: CoA transferase [Betaproteobacteria bacterium]|nr:CoA transferase [Betaproteobacteria bacterium]